MRTDFALVFAATAGLLCAPALALAQAAVAPPHVLLQKTIGQAKTDVVPSLIVINPRSATLQGGKLTLIVAASNTIVFADRPVRAAGHGLLAHLLEEWGVGTKSFAADPPNAIIPVFSNDAATVRDAVSSAGLERG